MSKVELGLEVANDIYRSLSVAINGPSPTNGRGIEKRSRIMASLQEAIFKAESEHSRENPNAEMNKKIDCCMARMGFSHEEMYSADLAARIVYLEERVTTLFYETDTVRNRVKANLERS